MGWSVSTEPWKKWTPQDLRQTAEVEELEGAVPARRAIRCDGWRRHGSAFSLGPITWEQCGNDAVVLLTIEQEGKIVNDSPACAVCWEESRSLGIKQIDAKPITTKRKS